MAAARSITAAGTRTFQSFLPATGTSATFTALADADGADTADAGEEPDAGDGGCASPCCAAPGSPALDPLSVAAATVPELAAMAPPPSVSRFCRCRSLRIPEACW